ncbi:MAG: adenylyltransferase/cytidyltransferase family protein [Verrucomicrobiota bacterium]
MIIPFESIKSWRAQLKEEGRSLVCTNGCFDILHIGHLRYLRAAASLGDILLVGLNDDQGIKELKGPERPINTQSDRAELLSALEMVDVVTVFKGARAIDFLAASSPDIYVKGGDYQIEDLYQPEVEVLRQCETQIKILPLIPGKSTTAMLEAMKDIS